MIEFFQMLMPFTDMVAARVLYTTLDLGAMAWRRSFRSARLIKETRVPHKSQTANT